MIDCVKYYALAVTNNDLEDVRIAGFKENQLRGKGNEIIKPQLPALD